MKPDGFLSRVEIEKQFKFSLDVSFSQVILVGFCSISLQDFEAIKGFAIISKNRGQKGLFFPLNAVRYLPHPLIYLLLCYQEYYFREHNDKKGLFAVPADWIDEQTLIRLDFRLIAN